MIDLSVPVYGATALTMPKPAAGPAPVPPKPLAVMPSYPAASHLLDRPEEWDWKQLRNYVLRAIEERHGPQPRGDEIKNAAIFQSFHQRWGRQAADIARFAFERQDGYWRNAPITVARFTKGNDPYFAEPISARLSTAA